MKPIIVVALLGSIGGLLAFHAGAQQKPAPAPRVGGLIPGDWYRLTVRSTFSREVFGVDAARQQAQALLGREGFDVRGAVGDPSDPFVYSLVGIYRGESGAMRDVPPGVLLIDATPATPDAAPPAEVAHIDDRPVALQPGVTYFARASIAWPLSMLVTRAKVIAKLQELGFRDVVATFDARELAPGWPQTERGGDLFVQATYAGEPKAMNVPSQILSVWS